MNWRISIHALREEGDLLFQRRPGAVKEFLSTPSARRATQQMKNIIQHQKISIHALRV